MTALDRIAAAIIDRRYQKILMKMEDGNMTYKLLKRIIQRGNYDKESMMQKLDVFLLADRITTEEYQELVEMINASDSTGSTTEGGDKA
jgi:hypothetical protein